MRGRLWGIALLPVLFLLCSCASESPMPRDSELADRLLANENSFDALAGNAGSGDLFAALGILSFREVSTVPPQYLYIVWEKDLPGPGGYVKGYFYSTQPPEGLVDSLDEIYDGRPDSQVEAYLHVKENWYLYYSAAN